MPITTTQRLAETNGALLDGRARIWRPFPAQAADVLCLEAVGDAPPRIHSRFGVTLLRNGATVRVESSRSIFAPNGSVVLIPAQQLHAWRTENPTDITVTLLVDPSLVKGVALPDRAALALGGSDSSEIDQLFVEMRRVRGLAQLEAVRLVLQYIVARSIPVVSPRSTRATPLGALRDYLRKHMSEPVPTETLVRMSGLTEWHLIRAFHLDFGLPPHAYHMRLRLAAAAELLSRGLSVSSAAYEAGFADQSHLSRHFKAAYGLTPAGWARSVGTVPNEDLLPRLESLQGYRELA